MMMERSFQVRGARGWGRKLLIPLLAVVWMLVGLYSEKPDEALACSCIGPLPLSEAMTHKTAVFAGKVTDIVPPESKPVMSSAEPVLVTLEVSRVWKGQVPPEVQLTTAMSSASCGYDGFHVGGEFLVMAHGEEQPLQTGLCDGTQPLAAAEPELSELGAGYEPLAKPSVAEQPQGPTSEGAEGLNEGKSVSSYWIPAGITLVVLAGLLLFILNKKRSA
ncbi:hypothetical protein ABDI30_00945 [Paenibacillus cisolokensis]|uniref:hypothetical protein n=1 Tax=Paenibacillus cisolokensis TaxID=1658519 RepID=UPI003D2961EB